MNEFIDSITSIPPPFNMIVLIVLTVTAGTTLGTVVKQLRKFACHRQELAFKRELLDRGLSADELERVVRVQTPAGDSER